MTMTQEEEKITRTFTTTYKEAVHWLHNSYVLCNNIVEIDDSLYDNMEFDYYDEENDSYDEIYQWFVTDCSQWDVEYLKKHFELKFTYSDKLDCYVLCVDHFGTSWDYVSNIVNCYGDNNPRCKTYKELTGYDY